MPNHKLAKTNAVWHKSYVEFSYKQQYKYKPVTHELLIERRGITNIADVRNMKTFLIQCKQANVIHIPSLAEIK